MLPELVAAAAAVSDFVIGFCVVDKVAAAAAAAPSFCGLFAGFDSIFMFVELASISN